MRCLLVINPPCIKEDQCLPLVEVFFLTIRYGCALAVNSFDRWLMATSLNRIRRQRKSHFGLGCCREEYRDRSGG
jgi:hypothetical protein